MKTKTVWKKAWVCLLVTTLLFTNFSPAMSAAEPGEVDVNIKVGDNQETTMSVAPGPVADMVKVIDEAHPTAKEESFERAVVVVGTNAITHVDIEYEISGLKIVDNVIYYTLPGHDGSAAIALQGKKVVFKYSREIYDVQYTVDTGTGGGGSVEPNPSWVGAGENLHITFYPDATSTVQSVHMIRKDDGTSIDYSASVVNNRLTVPASAIESDIGFVVAFRRDSFYSITASTISNGRFCPECSHASTPGSVLEQDGSLSVPADGPATFVLYSSVNAGILGTGNSWELNNLSLNGEDVRIPPLTINASAYTTLSDGTEVQVVYVGREFDSAHAGGLNYNRYKYEIIIANGSSVKQDYDIKANFKNDEKNEVIFKGLEGITSTGATREYTRSYVDITIIPPSSTTHYNHHYELYRDPANNVYTYHNVTTGYVNGYVFSVAPGYNPNTVEIYGVNTGTINDGVNITSPISPAFLPIGDLMNKIRSAGDPSTKHYYFGVPGEPGANWGSTSITQDNIPDISTSLYQRTRDQEYYAFYLNNSSSTNQMVYLNATKYQYGVQYNVDGGGAPITDDRRATLDEVLRITATNPTQEGHKFLGWHLVNEANESIDDKLYHRNEAFEITTENIRYAIGDATQNQGLDFYFKAVWEQTSTSAPTNTFTIKYYKEVSAETQGAVEVFDDGKYYASYSPDVAFDGLVGSNISALENRAEGNLDVNKHKFNEGKSKLEIIGLKDGEDGDWEEHNTLYYVYDLYSIGSLTIEKKIMGEHGDTTKHFLLALTIKDPNIGEGAEFTIQRDCECEEGVPPTQSGVWAYGDAPLMLYIKHNESVTIEGLSKDAVYTISETADHYDVMITGKYGDPEEDATFTIDEENPAKVSGSIAQGADNEAKDIRLTFTNKHERDQEEPIPETGVLLRVLPYVVAVGIILIIVVVYRSAKTRRKHTAGTADDYDDDDYEGL